METFARKINSCRRLVAVLRFPAVVVRKETPLAGRVHVGSVRPFRVSRLGLVDGAQLQVVHCQTSVPFNIHPIDAESILWKTI